MSAPKTKISVGMSSSAAGYAEKGAGDADAQAEGDTGGDLPTEFGRHERGQVRRQKPLADQQ